MTENTVDQPAAKRLDRSRSDRMLAGVCGGLARYFDVHPAFYRVGFVVLTLIGGAGLLIYLAAALVIPDEGKEESIASAALRDSRDRPQPLIGLGLIAVAGAVLLSRVSIWPRGDAAWILLLLAGLTILMLTRRQQRPAATQDEGAPGGEGEPTTVVVAPPGSRSTAGRVAKATGIAVGILVTLVLVGAAVFAAVLPVHLGRGIGERDYRVADVRDLRNSYSLGIGHLRVDLSGVRLPVGETHVRVRLDIGRVTVIVPREAALHARGEARFGEVELLGEEANGHDADRTIRERGKRVLVLDGRVGAGRLVVERAVR